MAQIFRPGANGLARAVLFLSVFGLGLLALIVYASLRSDYVTGVGAAPPQPVPFSHRHHVGGLGIDCRYCHTGVETSAFAGLPATEVCMTCHSQLWTNADLLAPVRDSLQTQRPLRWTRVNDLADFVFFNHSIHVQRGVACVTCHGPVERMALTYRAQAFHMKFCLDCHRNPQPHLRPYPAVFDGEWQAPTDRALLGAQLAAAHVLRPQRLTDCYLCHR